MSTQYDAIIIGTGQAGKPLARAFAAHGWKTAILERDRVGGTCVISGCTPTKTMVASARVAHLTRRAADYGVRTGPIEVDQAVVRKRKRDIVDSFSSGSQRGLERHEHIDLIFGQARFAGPDRVMVRSADGGDERELRAERIAINAGARPRIPDIAGLDDLPWLDSTSIMELDETPEHLVIVGGGFIGLEFGQMFRRFGSRVTIVHRHHRLAPREDPDLCEAIGEVITDDGIDVRLDTEPVAVAATSGGFRMTVRHEETEETLEGTHLLLAAGRVPNSDTLDLQAAGVATDDRGFIRVNERLETGVPGIWALGDITGGPAFTHVAYDDYRIVADNLVGDGAASTDGRLVPFVVYIDPQYGRVGLTETEARERGLDVQVVTMPMKSVARALETDETRGLMKAVIHRPSGRLLGAAVLGVEGGEIMSMMQIAMMGDLTWRDLQRGIFAHPTFAESLNNLFGKVE